MTLPSDLSQAEIYAAGNGTVDGPAEEFVVLAEGETAGYLEVDLRPDQRYLYWTVPGETSKADGKVCNKMCVLFIVGKECKRRRALLYVIRYVSYPC